MPLSPVRKPESSRWTWMRVSGDGWGNRAGRRGGHAVTAGREATGSRRCPHPDPHSGTEDRAEGYHSSPGRGLRGREMVEEEELGLGVEAAPGNLWVSPILGSKTPGSPCWQEAVTRALKSHPTLWDEGRTQAHGLAQSRGPCSWREPRAGRGARSSAPGGPGLRSGAQGCRGPTLGGQGVDVVISQPELAQLAAEALLIRGPVTKEVHGAVAPSLENLWTERAWGRVIADRRVDRAHRWRGGGEATGTERVGEKPEDTQPLKSPPPPMGAHPHPGIWFSPALLGGKGQPDGDNGQCDKGHGQCPPRRHASAPCACRQSPIPASTPGPPRGPHTHGPAPTVRVHVAQHGQGPAVGQVDGVPAAQRAPPREQILAGPRAWG